MPVDAIASRYLDVRIAGAIADWPAKRRHLAKEAIAALEEAGYTVVDRKRYRSLKELERPTGMGLTWI